MYIFLKHITDEDYKTTVAFCRNTKGSLSDCISAIRKQERDLTQQKLEKHRLKATIKRMKETVDSDDQATKEPKTKRAKKTCRTTTTPDKTAENCKFEGELIPTEKGLLRFNGDCWKAMDEKHKEFVREYNACVKHGDPVTKVTYPTGITVKTKIHCSTIKEEDVPTNNEKNHGKRKKGVTFGLGENEHSMGDIDE